MDRWQRIETLFQETLRYSVHLRYFATCWLVQSLSARNFSSPTPFVAFQRGAPSAPKCTEHRLAVRRPATGSSYLTYSGNRPSIAPAFSDDATVTGSGQAFSMSSGLAGLPAGPA